VKPLHMLSNVNLIYPQDLPMMGTGILSGGLISTLPDPNKLFTGRYSELQKIDTELLRSVEDYPTRIFPPAIQIYGPAGIGKTQLAREYVNQKYLKRNFSSVLWIEARSMQSIEKSFSELAQKISKYARNRYATMLAAPTKSEQVQSTNIPRPSSPLAPVSAIVDGQGLRLPAVKLVREWLAAPGNSSWLMVFDGADDCKSLRIEDFIPDVSHGNIILTGRNCDFAKFSRSILLGPMSEKDAIELLFKTTFKSPVLRDSERKPCRNLPAFPIINEDVENIDSSKELVELLGCLPLAICQAGAYLSSTGMSTEDYLKYRQAKPPYLNRNLVAAANGFSTTVSALSKSFEGLTRNHSHAKELLIFCSFLAPNCSIPGDVLVQAMNSPGELFFLLLLFISAIW
jgi:hypothetical protein